MGLVNTLSAKSDLAIASDLQNKLIDHPAGPLLDLAAVNINRGRDHGLASYSKYVTYCSGTKLTSFDNLANLNWATKDINLVKGYIFSISILLSLKLPSNKIIFF